jgi:hypothetical protein
VPSQVEIFAALNAVVFGAERSWKSGRVLIAIRVVYVERDLPPPPNPLPQGEGEYTLVISGFFVVMGTQQLYLCAR